MPFEPNFPPPKSWAPSGSGLTHRQLTGIGAVIVMWAYLEAAVQGILFTLAESPDWLGQALTEDLGPDHRLKALRRLCRHWERALEDSDTYQDHLATIHEAQAATIWIEKNKDRRNRVVHWLWHRANDQEMFAYKYTLKGAGSGVGFSASGNWVEITPEELMGFAEEIRGKADEMFKLTRNLEKLPPWPEKLGKHDPNS